MPEGEPLVPPIEQIIEELPDRIAYFKKQGIKDERQHVIGNALGYLLSQQQMGIRTLDDINKIVSAFNELTGYGVQVIKKENIYVLK